MNIVFLDRSTFPENVTFRAPKFQHQWKSYSNTASRDTIDHLDSATIAITNKVIIDDIIIKHCPKLRHIAVAATGVNNIDLEACAKARITVTNVADYAVSEVAEHTFMLILAVFKQLKAYSHALRQEQWQKDGRFCFFLDQEIHTLKGKTNRQHANTHNAFL
jgi:glycerate dehydrogenase